ncbi:hypothetical protein PI125_g10906 [Phytophthora idaei]|nr:hypothetical protein PI125_g10906 [Phytophthora idaei]
MILDVDTWDARYNAEDSVHATIVPPCPPDVDDVSVSLHCIVVGVPIDTSQKYQRGLQFVRAALELFTALFQINYKKYGELLNQKLPEDSLKCRLGWKLLPLEDLPTCEV